MESLPTGFKQANPRRHRNIHAFYHARQRNLAQFITGFARQTAQALTFSAHHQCKRLLQAGFIDRFFRFASSTNDANLPLLHFTQSAREIGHTDERHSISSTGGDLDCYRRESD